MIPTEVDIIVAGGGPAGCAVAGRLARADPNLQVCLVEAGASNYEGASSFSPVPLLDADPSFPSLTTDPWVYRPGIYVKVRSLSLLSSSE
jgi:alcohol oxidase